MRKARLLPVTLAAPQESSSAASSVSYGSVDASASVIAAGCALVAGVALGAASHAAGSACWSRRI